MYSFFWGNTLRNLLYIVAVMKGGLIGHIVTIYFTFLGSRHVFPVSEVVNIPQKSPLLYGASFVSGSLSPLPTYDFFRDDSLQKYVSPQYGLQVKSYAPRDLISIAGNPHIIIQNNQAELRKEAAEALYNIAEAFFGQFQTPLVVVSSYRGFAYQEKLLDGYIKKLGETLAYGLSARPGHSEHQLGLAIDVFSATSDADFRKGYGAYYDWMRNHAHEYGWTQSYQKGRVIDGYVVEPWHWRYVGVELATYLWQNNMTFGEYFSYRHVW